MIAYHENIVSSKWHVIRAFLDESKQKEQIATTENVCDRVEIFECQFTDINQVII